MLHIVYAMYIPCNMVYNNICQYLTIVAIYNVKYM